MTELARRHLRPSTTLLRALQPDEVMLIECLVERAVARPEAQRNPVGELQVRILEELSEAPDLSATALVDRLRSTLQSVCVSLLRLEEHGLVVADAPRRRGQRWGAARTWRITDAGTSTLRAAASSAGYRDRGAACSP